MHERFFNHSIWEKNKFVNILKEVECLQNRARGLPIFLVHYIANNILFDLSKTDFHYIAYFLFFFKTENNRFL